MSERFSWIRSAYLQGRARGLRVLAKKLGPVAYFKWVRAAAAISYYIYPPDRRRATFLRQAMKGKFQPSDIPVIVKKNILNRKWHLALSQGWACWRENHEVLVRITGEEHLARALEQGRGAVLLSGHAHGFGSMVAPAVSRMGYRCHRVVRARRKDPRKRFDEDTSCGEVSYIALGNDTAEHMRGLQRMRSVIKRNEVLHLPIRGFPSGKPEFEIEFFYKRFFLDPSPVQILEIVKAPVCPCFAFCDDFGKLLIEIHPALAPSAADIVRGFGSLYSNVLARAPEFAHFWRRVVRQQDGW